MTAAEPRALEIEEHRAHLFSVAYRLLGSASDAEDVLQDLYLRLASSPPSEPIREPRAYLTTLAARLSLDRLKSARARREVYVGPWLPEPVLTEDAPPLPLDTVELTESISLAALVALERLTPEERAVLVLHDAFGYSHDELAEMLGKSSAASRQLLHRARGRVGDPRRRRARPTPTAHRRLVERLVAACERGDVQGLASVLREDVMLWSDGGGKVVAALRPIHGADAVGRLLLGLTAKAPPGMRFSLRTVNGDTGVVLELADAITHVLAFEVIGRRVAGIRVVANPDKLAFFQRQMRVAPVDEKSKEASTEARL